MVIVEFPDGSDWFKANWVFRRLAEDVAAVFPQKIRAGDQLIQAMRLGSSNTWKP